ncbi:hypothetical protein [Bacillus mycoides]|uniref:hypothetical protein n=1 Tax=Bacillus mycoides TaxID=1405 RepID=UPI003D02EA15
MPLTLLLLIFIIILFISALIFMTVKKRTFLNRPHLQSFIVCTLFFANWILYLTNFYSLLPEKVSQFIFLSIWFFLCVLGLIVFTREWKNNRIFSISIGFLSFIPH